MWRPFEEAVTFAQSLALASQREWEIWCTDATARPTDIPTTPSREYAATGWRGWGHWLGTGNVQNGSRERRPFAEAAQFAQSLGLRSASEWAQWSAAGGRPADIPARPEKVYTGDGEWQGWGHWLGTGNTRTGAQRWRPFPEAAQYAQSLGLTSRSEWRQWSKGGGRPADIPADPSAQYATSGWCGWHHWLTGGNVWDDSFPGYAASSQVTHSYHDRCGT